MLIVYRYTSIRIDAVHYCALEDELADRRKKAAKHFRTKSYVDPGEVPGIRLSLLCRTVRESQLLSQQVLYLKLPYMTRETCKGEVARTISALPNLRYVDLPDGFFSGEASCLPLRQELQARCPDIRKMIYRAGAEDALEYLAQRHWQCLETLELNRLAIETETLRIVLASLPILQNLVLSDLTWMDDSVFISSSMCPDFPQLHTLSLENIPNVTAAGLQTYLSVPYNREVLSSLTLQNTGVTVPDLHTFLWGASALQHLAIVGKVSKSLALNAHDLPLLASISLRTLNFEITSADDVHGLQKPTESYYAYLATSLHANALPALSTLYVRDQSFPDLLLLPPFEVPFRADNPSNGSLGPISVKGSNASTASHRAMPMPQTSSFNQILNVFSKGIDELEWVFTSIIPPAQTRDRRGSATGGRPLSAYSASRGLGPQWAQGGFGGEARKSVVVGNGFGGFLAVPQEEVPRPMTSEDGNAVIWGINGTQDQRQSSLRPPPSLSSLASSMGSHDTRASSHETRSSRHDLWR